jgi:alpha-N-arabinofuranosidase
MSEELFGHAPRDDDSTATVTVDPFRRADHEVPPELFAKFAEHLGWNVYHGMDAQLLFNPTFGEWPFPAGCANSPDGGQRWETDPETVQEQIEEFAAIQDLPESEPLAEFYESGGAFWWHSRGDVAVSPDTGPTGDRAQRIEVGGAAENDSESAVNGASSNGAGIQQWVYLPLQRTDGYELELRARAASETTLTVALKTTASDSSPDERVASAEIDVSTDWTTAEATLSVPDDVDAGDDDLFVAAVTAAEPANLVLDRVLLYPDDHVNRADPDVIEYLRESDLPLLRWPGGNFVSGYDWTDGVGPVGERPTKPNPAWGGLEYNLFGTAEFIEFCEAVGCEPMLCVNAGDGTPEEAARWVEYCNGDPEETEMGALRAEHGYEEPFDVTYWEVGNELYGQWQVRWTTPDGYADRYERFREAMLEADPSIQLTACGCRQARPQDRNVGTSGTTRCSRSAASRCGPSATTSSPADR